MLANVRQVGSGLRSLGVGGEGETFFNIYGSTSYVYLSLGSASWELDANKPKPDGETRIRRSYAVKELLTRESTYVPIGWQC